MKIRLITFISILVINLPAQAGFSDLFKLKKLKKEYQHKTYQSPPRSYTVERETIGTFRANRKPLLNFTLAGNINFYLEKEDQLYYPLIRKDHQQDFFKSSEFSDNPFFKALDKQAQDLVLRYTVKEPEANSPYLHKESQLLLQEFARDQLIKQRKGELDLVFFTGNQIYSNNQANYFYDNIVESFDKYRIPHYEVLGYNEARGTHDIKKFMGDFYYLLQTKNTNFIVLNNLFNEVIPQNLPQEASEQFLWLEKILEKLENENFGEDLIIITYKEPSKTLIDYISKHDHLNLIAFIYGEDEEYSEAQWEGILFISTPSLSKYPCSYLSVHRDQDGFYDFKEVKLNLPGIQKHAEEKLKDGH